MVMEGPAATWAFAATRAATTLPNPESWFWLDF